uniref:Uncharacterized protein n=1 Tax=Timema monikensis TaxID=170555 RepID=A0A7R9EKV4_9NEOP|nr:unnamed protein product [Timema monikensis]
MKQLVGLKSWSKAELSSLSFCVVLIAGAPNSEVDSLQLGFLLSSTQQMVDRLVVQTQDTIRSLAQESTDSNNEINLATGLIQDADNSKQQEPVQCACATEYRGMEMEQNT